MDVRTTQGRLTLTAYLWPDQPARHERLRGAIALAQQAAHDLRRQSAGAFVDDVTLLEGTTTVLWHSLVWQFLEEVEQKHVRAGVEALGAAATVGAPFAHVSLEPTRRTPLEAHETLLVVERWPGGDREVLATSGVHGLPVSWER